MNNDDFNLRKESLVNLITDSLTENNISNQGKTSLYKILEILKLYTYENRYSVKGLLSHTIVDSLEMDYSIAEKLIKFDRFIT